MTIDTCLILSFGRASFATSRIGFVLISDSPRRETLLTCEARGSPHLIINKIN